jgi:hypothetical protein
MRRPSNINIRTHTKSLLPRGVHAGKAIRGSKRGGRNIAGLRLMPHKYKTTVKKRHY